MSKIAFIGSGNMASAIAGGIIKSKTVSPSEIILFDKNEEQYKKFDAECKKASCAKEAALCADYVFFSVKGMLFIGCFIGLLAPAVGFLVQKGG